MLIENDRILTLVPDAVVRNVAGEAVILMVTTGQSYTGNQTASEFISRFDGTRTVGDIADKLAEEYDVPPDRLLSDLTELLEYLCGEGVIADPV